VNRVRVIKPRLVQVALQGVVVVPLVQNLDDHVAPELRLHPTVHVAKLIAADTLAQYKLATLRRSAIETSGELTIHPASELLAMLGYRRYTQLCRQRKANAAMLHADATGQLCQIYRGAQGFSPNATLTPGGSWWPTVLTVC
jgi:hypothetical protein